MSLSGMPGNNKQQVSNTSATSQQQVSAQVDTTWGDVSIDKSARSQQQVSNKSATS
jgi:hypothetical protein